MIFSKNFFFFWNNVQMFLSSRESWANPRSAPFNGNVLCEGNLLSLESNFKGQRPGVDEMEFTKMQCRDGGTIEVITGQRNNPFRGFPARCVNFINGKISMTNAIQCEFQTCGTIPMHLPLIAKLTSLFFYGRLFVK